MENHELWTSTVSSTPALNKYTNKELSQSSEMCMSIFMKQVWDFVNQKSQVYVSILDVLKNGETFHRDKYIDKWTDSVSTN